MELLSNHRVFQTGDLEEGANFAGRVWERNKTIHTMGCYGLRWNQADLNKTSLAYIEHDCAVDLRAEGPLSDNFRVFFHRGGAIGHTLNGRKFDSHQECVLVHAPDSDLKLDIRPFHLLLLTINGAFVRSALAQRLRGASAPERWVALLHNSPPLEAFRSMTYWLAAELDRPSSLLAKPSKPLLHAERLLLSLFMECLAETAPEGSEEVLDIGHRQVRQAEDWIEGHLTDPIGVEEIASALNVSVRSLQLTFKRVRGRTPLEAVNHRRLECARVALLKADQEATVTAIATRYGCYELGRFSKRYREHFGETPSETLARRPSPHNV